MDLCACMYNYLQPLDDLVDFDDDNTLCQTVLDEVFGENCPTFMMC